MHEALHHIRVLQLMCEKEQLNLVLEEASEFSFRASGDSLLITLMSSSTTMGRYLIN